MAFMVPVMKKEFDIYKTGRSRRASECSSSNASCRSRKISECPSLSTSPGSDYIGHSNTGSHNGRNGHVHPSASTATMSSAAAAAAAGSHHASGHAPHAMRSQSIPVNRNLSRTVLGSSSRASQSSLITSPTKAASSGCSPPKPTAGSQGSLNKFHQRLVDKLRKSLRKARSEDRS